MDSKFSEVTALFSLPGLAMKAKSACVCAKLLHSCPTLCDPMDYTALQGPLSMGFSKQEYWNGFLCHSPGDLPDPGIEPESPMSSAMAGGVFTTSTT